MDKAFNRKSVILLFLLPGMLVYTLFVIVTILWAAGYSFFDWNGLGSMHFIGLKNYIQLFSADPTFWPIVGHTLLYTFWELLLQVFGGLMLAIFLTRLTVGRVALQTLYYMPVVISSVAICQIFSKLFSVTPAGVIDAALGALNPAWRNIVWISSPSMALGVDAFVDAFRYAGIYMVIFYAALISVPAELTEAASIDGATTFRQYWNIQLPYILPVIITNCVLVLNGSMRSFDIPYLLTKGGPGYNSEVLATYMYKQAFTSMKYGYGSAVAITIVIFCILLGTGFSKLTSRGEEDS